MGKRGGAKAKRARPQPSATSPAPGASTGVFKGLKCRHTSSTSKLNGLFNEARPFPHLFVEGVFQDALLTQAKDELLAGEWFRKRVDLYDFLQTDHLRRQSSSASAVATIQDALYGYEFRSWLEAVTGIKTLARPVDTSAAQYTKGGHLLCHDDDLSGRVIAFIIYLVPPTWDSKDGGALDLFDVDPSTGFPTVVSKSLTPQWNSMAFFAVTPGSFHQVAEVLTEAKGSRMSISGWFHGTPPSRPSPLPLPAPTFLLPTKLRGRAVLPGPPALLGEGDTDRSSTLADSDGSEAVALDIELLSKWIHPRWLATVISGSDTADHFAETGSIELFPFLRADAYSKALAAMRAQQWHRVGPAHLREYAVAAACHCEPDGFLPHSVTSLAAKEPRQASLAAPVPAVGALSLAALKKSLTASQTSAAAQVSAPASSADSEAVESYARASSAIGGPRGAWRTQATTGPDAAIELWQFLRSSEFADFFSLLTGCGQVQQWAVEARALTAGSYTLVTDPQLQQRRRSKQVDEAVEEMSSKRSTLAATILEEEEEAEEENDDDDDDDDDQEPLRLEACFCMLDNHQSVPGAAAAASASASSAVESTDDDSSSWPEAVGGYTVMLSAEEELCTVEPRANALSILGVPDGATTFVKFITAECPGVRYDVRIQADA